MNEKSCACGCGKKLRSHNTTGYFTGHKAGNGAGGGRPKRAAAASRGRVKANGNVTITVTPELCDAIWASLPLEKKAALLNNLAELRAED